jgi:hypothetical protein
MCIVPLACPRRHRPFVRLRDGAGARGIQIRRWRTRCTSPPNAATSHSTCACSTAGPGCAAARSACSSDAAALCPRAGHHAECQGRSERKNNDFTFHDFLFLNLRNRHSEEETARGAIPFLHFFSLRCAGLGNAMRLRPRLQAARRCTIILPIYRIAKLLELLTRNRQRRSNVEYARNRSGELTRWQLTLDGIRAKVRSRSAHSGKPK